VFRSLSSRILTGFVLVATVPVVAVAVWEDVADGARTVQVAQRDLRLAAEQISVDLERQLGERRAALSLAARLFTDSGPVGSARHRAALAAIHADYPEFRTVALLDATGVLVALEPDTLRELDGRALVGQSFAHREYFQSASRDTATVVTSVYQAKATGDRVIVGFGRALRDGDGGVRAVLQGSVELTEAKSLGAVSESSQAGVGYLVTDPNGVVALRAGPIPVAPLDTLTTTTMQERWGVVPSGSHGEVNASPEWFVASARTATGWQVLVERSRSDVMAISRERRASAARATGLAIALGIVITLLLMRSVRDPLQRMMAWLREFDVRDGRTPTELPGDTPAEIRDVILAMGSLGARLQLSYGEVERALAERETLNQQLNGVLRELDARVAVRTAELQEALRKAEDASVTKSRFLANMSHELRTPLNSVIGFSSVLMKNRAGRLTSADLDLLDRILANGRHLLALINDILDISKIEAGRVALDVDDVDVVALAHETLSHLEGQIGGKTVLLRYDGPAVAPLVRTDVGKLRQILVNLVGNAIKFTERGSVTLLVETGPDGSVTALGVRDTGIGIPADRLGAIFEPFEQADTSTSRRFGGTGLGLAICRALSEMLGGHLTVESRPGEGSIFRVVLGAVPAEPRETEARVKAMRASRGILVG